MIELAAVGVRICPSFGYLFVMGSHFNKGVSHVEETFFSLFSKVFSTTAFMISAAKINGCFRV